MCNEKFNETEYKSSNQKQNENRTEDTIKYGSRCETKTTPKNITKSQKGQLNQSKNHVMRTVTGRKNEDSGSNTNKSTIKRTMKGATKYRTKPAEKCNTKCPGIGTMKRKIEFFMELCNKKGITVHPKDRDRGDDESLEKKQQKAYQNVQHSAWKMV